MIAAYRNQEFFTFSSELGWMAAITLDGRLLELVFGGKTPQDAVRRLDESSIAAASLARRPPKWTSLLTRYAAGRQVDLAEIPIAWREPLSPFQRRVLDFCRRIPYGQVATYGELAQQAGYPRAARAVGNVMAANRVPIVVPCHRVVAAGDLGRYSASGGTRMKLRLLEMEAARRRVSRKGNARRVAQ
jgi:methylated-DNA-[protein]-cysteine S-methyltransferase